MSRRIFAVILFAAVLVLPALAEDDPAPPKPADPVQPAPPAQPPAPVKPEEPKIATDKEAKHELDVFRKDFDTPDIDFKLEALHRFSKCVHESVMKELLAISARNPDPFIRAEAIKGLRYQIPFKDKIAPKLAPLVTNWDTDAKIMAEAVLTLGVFEWKRSWEAIAELIAHDDDNVVVNALHVLGVWKELRACAGIAEFWEVYPEEGKWSTGSVTVDTGSAGDEDQRAAKAKWMGRYGNKGKQRARADCVKAVKEAVKNITGEALEKPAEFRQWMKDHKAEIKAAEKLRD